MHWVSTSPLKISTPLFLANTPLNWKTVQTPLFRRPQPSILVFCENPPKSRIFQLIPKILKFFAGTPSYLIKVSRFLVKISQFEFYLWQKNIFAYYKLFLSLNISHFNLLFYFYFYFNPLPLKKVNCSFPVTPFKS